MDRSIKLNVLIRIMKRYGVAFSPSAGKGSHAMFVGEVDGRPTSYTVPTSRDMVLTCYLRGIRKRFHLTANDGVSDESFYNG